MTGDLGSELNALHGQHRDEHADARPGPDVARSIARRHRARRGLWGGAAAAAILLVGAAAMPSIIGALPSASAPSASPSPVLSITERVVEEITMPFPSIEDDDVDTWAFRARPEACGQPLPEPALAVDDFSVSWVLPDAIELSLSDYSGTGTPEARATLTYDGEGEVPATVDPMMALFVHDGVVVGWAPGYQEPRFHTYASGAGSSTNWEGWGAFACTDRGEEAQELPAGDYRAAFAVSIHASTTQNALQDLRQHGYEVPPIEYLGAYREGSYECERAIDWDMGVPITCDPDTLHGVELDLEAGEVTFPYRASAYVRDVDATFVSDAVPAKVEEGVDPFQEFRNQVPAYEPPAQMQCGDVFSELGDGPLDLQAERTRTTYAVDNVIDTRAWVYGAAWTEATVDLPPTARMWLTVDEELSVVEGGGGVSYGFGGYRTVGWAEVDLPERIVIDRFDGPEPVALRVTAVTWCEGEPSGQVLYPVLSMPHTVTVDGEPTESQGAAIWGGYSDF